MRPDRLLDFAHVDAENSKGTAVLILHASGVQGVGGNSGCFIAATRMRTCFYPIRQITMCPVTISPLLCSPLHAYASGCCTMAANRPGLWSDGWHNALGGFLCHEESRMHRWSWWPVDRWVDSLWELRIRKLPAALIMYNAFRSAHRMRPRFGFRLTSCTRTLGAGDRSHAGAGFLFQSAVVVHKPPSRNTPVPLRLPFLK